MICAPWLSGAVETQALGYAVRTLVPEHLAEIKTRRIVEIDKVEREVRARLTREINYWDARAARLREEERAGKEQRINAQNAEATAARLVERLHKRQAELDRERQISAVPPVLKGAALVIPAGLLKARLPAAATSEPKPDGFSEDPIARAMIEKLAMDAVMAAERMLGNEPRDVSAENKGYDIESRDPRAGRLRFIEVKGRHVDRRDLIVTKNEILALLNAPEAFVLAIVQVEGGFAREPVYAAIFTRSFSSVTARCTTSIFWINSCPKPAPSMSWIAAISTSSVWRASMMPEARYRKTNSCELLQIVDATTPSAGAISEATKQAVLDRAKAVIEELERKRAA